MKKLVIFSLMLALSLTTLSAVDASMIIPSSDRAKEKAKAPEKSPVISDTDSGEWDLERVDFIHYAKPDHPGKPDKQPKQDLCYKLMGVKWNNAPVDYVINPLNNEGLSESFVTSVIATSAEAWDRETSLELWNDSPSIDYTAEYGVQDYNNAIVFGNYDDSSVIGITSVWFTRRGKQIVEFDMLFNESFNWGDADLDPSVMDLRNIATHELGHAVGMDDVYSTSCADVTMYGYSGEGDTTKRSLETLDIAGLQKMYGI